MRERVAPCTDGDANGQCSGEERQTFDAGRAGESLHSAPQTQLPSLSYHATELILARAFLVVPAAARRRCAVLATLCIDVRRQKLLLYFGDLRVRAGPEPQNRDTQVRELACANANQGWVAFGSAVAHARARGLAARRVNEGKWDVRQIITSGGMPSSHSALVRSAHSSRVKKRDAAALRFRP